MRIAGRRPWFAPVSLQLQPRFAFAALLIAAISVAVAVPLAAREENAALSPTTSRLSMADAFGVGGLDGLRVEDGAEAAEISVLDHNQVVAYYGTPRQRDMGILGEFDAEPLAWMLRERAERVDALNGDPGVVPMLHLVYAVAQPEASHDGLHLRYVDDRTVRLYLALARSHGFGLIIDLQIGHSSALAEVQKVLTYLEEPDVHLALDPEFALAGREKPGEAIGSIDASDINAVQWLLEGLSRSRGLPQKLLIVHQFESSMVTNPGEIERHEGVDLVIDMDGYGPADIKAVKYQRYGQAPYAAFGGIKIFLQHDPIPMTERQILDIEPPPSFILYQ